MARHDPASRLDRLRLFTRTVPGAAEVLTFFESKKVVAKLVTAAAAGVPPVTAVSQDLIELLGPKRAKDPQLAKFVGRATRAVLEAHGFELSQRNVRVRSDPIFTVGSAYRKVEKAPSSDDSNRDIDLLSRFLDSLNERELEQVRQYLRRR